MILITDYFQFDLTAKILDSYPVIPFPIQGNPQELIMVMPGQGTNSRYYTTSLLNLSILVQGINDRATQEVANEVHNLYRDQINYEIELPVSYKSTEAPRSINCLYIQAIDRPVPLGDVGNSRYQYTVNFMIQLGGLE